MDFYKDLKNSIRSNNKQQFVDLYEKGRISLRDALRSIEEDPFIIPNEKNITPLMIKEGFNKGIVKLVVDPMSSDGKTGVCCQIGKNPQNYLFFGGVTAANMTVKQYLRLPLDDIIREIVETLNDFKNAPEYWSEYELYYSILKEHED